MDKVLTDFGIKEKPEGYVSESDKAFQRLDEVGKTELKRLNIEERHGEIKYEEQGLRGFYYKEVKVYDNYYPLDVQPVAHASDGGMGYTGYIEYSYRVMQSPKKTSRAEASAEVASIPTDNQGRDTFRYNFGPGGIWDGGKGERAKR